PRDGFFVVLIHVWSPAALQPPFDITGDLDTPVSAFMKLAAFAPRFLLESVEGGERLARYSFIGFGDGLEVRLDGAGLTIGDERRPAPASGAELLAAPGSGARAARRAAQRPAPRPLRPADHGLRTRRVHGRRAAHPGVHCRGRCLPAGAGEPLLGPPRARSVPGVSRAAADQFLPLHVLLRARGGGGGGLLS